MTINYPSDLTKLARQLGLQVVTLSLGKHNGIQAVVKDERAAEILRLVSIVRTEWQELQAILAAEAEKPKPEPRPDELPLPKAPKVKPITRRRPTKDELYGPEKPSKRGTRSEQQPVA